MKILITAATLRELDSIKQAAKYNADIRYLVSGIGAVATCYSLTKALLSEKFDAVIQIGIAGAFHKYCDSSKVVVINRDCFADFGVDDRGIFTPAANKGFLIGDNIYTSGGWLLNPCPTAFPEWKKLLCVPEATAITVQTVSGSTERISEMQRIYNPDIETMEGAALFYTCIKQNIPFMALRAISNKVEPRNKSAWDIDGALKALATAISSLISSGI